MTIDKAKLKALAEAATPGRHYDRLESAGGGIKYECTGDDGSLVLKVDHKNNEFGFVGDRGEADEAFFLACGPATILALLAEIERLEKFEDWFVRLDQAEQSLSASFKAERDQLKAENEALRTDAERYRWLRNPAGTIVVRNVQCHLFGSRMDEQVDAARSASAKPAVECDACPRSSGCVGSCMKVAP